MKNSNSSPDFYPKSHPPLSNNYQHIEELIVNSSIEFSLPVSIVIPFYKGLEILDKSLASLCCQSYPQRLMEVIISEDGAPINSQSLVDKYKPLLNISRVTHTRNGYRLATTRNNGIRKSCGSVVIIVDFDIVTPPFFVESHMKWFHSSANIASFGLRRFVDLTSVEPQNIRQIFAALDEIKPVASISNRLRELDKRIPELEYIKTHTFPCNLFHGCNIAFWKSHALQVGLFDEDFNGHSNYEDLEFGYRLFQAGDYIVHEPNAFVLHQENEIVDYVKRMEGMKHNKKLIYKKVPGFQDFRASIGQE
jgi:glycosyltransferase involved in cell wall biosynthesis